MAADARRNRALASWASAQVAANARSVAIITFMVSPPREENTGREALFRALDVERQGAGRQVVVPQAAVRGLGQRLGGRRGGVLLRASRPVRDLEDLHGRHGWRGFQEAAVGFGRHAQQRPQALAVEHHRVAQHVRRAESGLRDDVVLADLEIPALDCWKSHDVLCGWKGAKQRTAPSYAVVPKL